MLDFEDFKREYQKVPVEEYPNNVLDAVPEPMVSVQISTYQHADFIRDCLDGVLMQETDFPIEILIGEDESTDGTREICKEYAERYPDKIRLFLHRRENNIKIHGRPTGRFQAVYTRFHCRGKYIAICEGDDYWTDPKKLQKQVDFLREYAECSTCFSATRFFSEQAESYQKVLRPEEDNPAQKMYTLEEFLERALYFFTGSVVYRNNLWDELPSWYFDTPVGDWPLFVLCGQEGHFGFIDEVTCAHRKHEGGAWSGSSTFGRYHMQLATRETVKPHLSSDLQRKLNPKIQSIYSSLLDEAISNNEGELVRKYARESLRLISYKNEYSFKDILRLLYYVLYDKNIDYILRGKLYHNDI